MISKSNDYIQVLKGEEQEYDVYIVLQNGTIVNEDISGFKIIYNLGKKIIGNFATKRVEFSLFNTSQYNITNQEFEVFVGLKVNNAYDYVSIGNFIANKPEIKDEKLDECNIVGQNNSIKFKTKYVPVITFPCKISEAIESICEHLNFECDVTNFINKDYIVEEFFIDEDATFFDVIKVLVEAGFANADIDSENILVIKSPHMQVDYSFDLEEMFESQKEDNKYGKINSIVASRIVADDGSTTEDVYARNEPSIAQNGLFEYKIIQNDAIDYDRQTAVNNILNGILNFEYIPAKIETVYNPLIELIDMLQVPDVKTQTTFLLFAKEININLSTGLMTIESTEDTKTETDYKSATVSDKRKKTEFKVSKLEGKVSQVISEQTEQGERINTIESTVEGTIQRVSSIETSMEEFNENFAEQRITNEEIISSVSQVETKMTDNFVSKEELNSQMAQTSEQFTFEINSAISDLNENGISKVNTATVTIDKEGILVGKSNNEYVNRMNNTGNYQYYGGVLTAKYDKDGAEIPKLKTDIAIIAGIKYVKRQLNGITYHETYALE